MSHPRAGAPAAVRGAATGRVWTDPRPAVVGKRLAEVGRIVAFCSAKGGVGKTLCTALSGLVLEAAGRRCGILDLDTQGASAHAVLGVPLRFPDEDKGILPLPVTGNLTLMGAAPFSGERGLPLRGPDVSDAILELLAVTRWGALDFLLIDMPPGIGEEILDLARLAPRLQALVVSTPSSVSVLVVERLLSVLKEIGIAVPGVIANMVAASADPVASLARRHGVPLLGEVPLDPGIEGAMGNLQLLRSSAAAAGLQTALGSLGWV